MNPQIDPILAIAVLVNLLKPLLTARLPQAAGDAAVQLAAIAIGVGGQLGYTALTGSLSQHDLPALTSTGFSNAVWAIILYHLARLSPPEAMLAGLKGGQETPPAGAGAPAGAPA